MASEGMTMRTESVSPRYRGPNLSELWLARDPDRTGTIVLRIQESGRAPVDLLALGPQALRWLAFAALEAAEQLERERRA